MGGLFQLAPRRVMYSFSMSSLTVFCVLAISTTAAVPQAEPEGGFRDVGHVFDDSLSNSQRAFIEQLLEHKNDAAGFRNLHDFAKMAFWAIVTAVTINNDNSISLPLTQDQIDSINVHGGDVTGIQFASDVNLTSALDWYHDSYTEHGCYCWPEGKENITGFGRPRDDLDRVCHSLYTCYRCLRRQPECPGLSSTISQDYACQFSANNDT